MARRRPRLVKDYRVAIGLALVAQVTAVVLLDDAFEARGRTRPRWLRVLGGVG